MYYKDLFLAISDKLATLVDENGKPVFQWIDFDLGQLEEQTPSVSFPCALIDFEELSDIYTYVNGSENGTQAITIRLAFKKFERTHTKVPSLFQAEALAHLDAVALAHKALANLSGASFSTLARTGQSRNKRPDIRIYELYYGSRIFDDSGEVIKYVPYAQATGGSPAHPDFCAHPAPDPRGE